MPTSLLHTAHTLTLALIQSLLRSVTRLRRRGEAGMTTAEYAIGTLAACTFAALLVAVVRSPQVRAALAGVISTALALGR